MLSFVQNIEMNRGKGNLSTSPANVYYEMTDIATWFNPNDFDGTVTIYFEANLENSSTTPTDTAYVQLYDHTDGVAVAGSQLSITGESPSEFPQRLRSGPLTFSGGDRVYTIQLKHTSTTSDAIIAGARLIVMQSGTITKTQIHQELGVNGGTSSTSNTYVIPGAAAFLFEAAKYDGNIAVRHDALLIATSGNTTTSGIYDMTAGSTVSGSQLSTSATVYGLFSSGNITLTDGHRYQPTAYVSGGASADCNSNKLVFTITGGFSKYLAYIAVYCTSYYGGGSNDSDIYPNYNCWIDNYINFDTTQWSGLTYQTYYEGYMSIANSADAAWSNLDAYVYNTSANSIVGTDVSYTGSTSVGYARSAAFSMPSGATDICTGIASNTSSVTAIEYNGYIIMEVSGIPQSSITGVSSITGISSITF